QQRKSGRTKATLIVAASVYGAVVMVTALHGRADGFDGGSISGGGSGFLLTGARPAPPSTIASYIRDNDTAIALGKALFWDAQAGRDGRQACASCHFNAGSDNGATNTLNPGHNGVFDQTSTGHSGPNATITAGDFPFHRLTDINDNGSTVAHDTDDDFGSQGVLFRSFNFVRASALHTSTPPS